MITHPHKSQRRKQHNNNARDKHKHSIKSRHFTTTPLSDAPHSSTQQTTTTSSAKNTTTTTTTPSSSSQDKHPNNPATTTTNTSNKTNKMSERAKMIAGLEFDVRNMDLAKARSRAKQLQIQLNNTPTPFSREEKQVYSNLLRQLLPHAHKSAYLTTPFTCDYGFNITLGEQTFINANCTFLDVGPITIGRNVMFGPGVHVYGVTHHVDWRKRREGYTLGQPVVIGDDCWIGGNSVIMPNITIGARSIIGAGSVVTKDVPEDTFVAGNPAVIKKSLKNLEDVEFVLQQQQQHIPNHLLTSLDDANHVWVSICSDVCVCVANSLVIHLLPLLPTNDSSPSSPITPS